MITLKRRGYTDTVTAIINDIYLEYHHLTGSVLIEQSYTIEKSFKGRKYEESHHKNLYSGKTNYKGENPVLAITELESLIKLHAGLDVEFNSFVEAYDVVNSTYNKMYPYLNLDKKYFDNKCVDGLQVSDVIKDYSCLEFLRISKVMDIITENKEKVGNMLFVDLYTLLKDLFTKENYKELFISSMKSL